MIEEGIKEFRDALEAETGTHWLKTCSHLVGRGSHQEMYCFIWQEDSLTFEGGDAIADCGAHAVIPPYKKPNRRRQSLRVRWPETKLYGRRDTLAERSSETGADTTAEAVSRPRCTA